MLATLLVSGDMRIFWSCSPVPPEAVAVACCSLPARRRVMLSHMMQALRSYCGGPELCPMGAHGRSAVIAAWMTTCCTDSE